MFRCVLFLIIVCVPSVEPLQAQLIGRSSRSRLNDVDRRSSTGTSTLFGADLGIRESRGTGAFVGADPTDQTGFIGVAEVIPPVSAVAATEGLREEFIQNVNEVVATRTAAGIYTPRLTIAFEPIAPSRVSQSPEVRGPAFPPGALQFEPSKGVSSPLLVDPTSRLQESLGKTLGTEGLAPIQVSVANRTATLRGSVASADDRSLAELVASFEPGIDQVQNELTVQSRPSTLQE